MKRTNILFYVGILLLSGVVSFTSCSKDNNDSPKPSSKTTATAEVNAVDNGESFSFSASPSNVVAGIVRDSLALSLIDTKTKTQIVIALFPVPGAGSYSFDENNSPACIGWMNLDGESTADVFYMTGTDMDGNGEADGTGKFTITSLTDNHIKGTFSMTMYNYMKEKTVISSGKFDCPLYRR